MQDILELIKEIVLNTANRYNVEIDKIILFGSRARGDYKKNSDWDILIVVKNKVDKKILYEFWSELDWKLAKYIVPEIIVVDKETFEKYKHLTGFVYYWAEKEGILIK